MLGLSIVLSRGYVNSPDSGGYQVHADVTTSQNVTFCNFVTCIFFVAALFASHCNQATFQAIESSQLLYDRSNLKGGTMIGGQSLFFGYLGPNGAGNTTSVRNSITS